MVGFRAVMCVGQLLGNFQWGSEILLGVVQIELFNNRYPGGGQMLQTKSWLKIIIEFSCKMKQQLPVLYIL